MDKIDELVDGLEEKIRGIIGENQRLIIENSELKREKTTLQERIKDQSNQIKQLIEELENPRQSGLGKEKRMPEGMKAEIERLVREIDICIELLNR